MYNNTIYYILGALAIIYILISMNNRRQSKDRKSRKFMDTYERKESIKKENNQEE
ncbi:hypothetical protein ZORO111903_20075 [Zobellia roscoffensis]|uniref:hypothetical protein n=1 Tax=Zobellia roscoffensis TaxID=2779508 RepID=UPI00188ABF7E|nr:hypothetical protein [Zobellia roscoffensis]